MHLMLLEVKGFRSIKGIKLPLDSRTIVLVGRNSTGKSNILRAMRLATNISEVAKTLRNEDFSPGVSRLRLELGIVISAEEHKSLSKTIRTSKGPLGKPLADFERLFYTNLVYKANVTKDGLVVSYYLGYRKLTKSYPLFGKGAVRTANKAILHKFLKMLRSQYLMIGTEDYFDRISEENQNKIARLLMHQFVSPDPSERSRYNEVRDGLLFITEGIGGEIQPAELPVAKKISEVKYQLRSEIEKAYHVPLSYIGEGAKRVALVLYHIVNSTQQVIGVEEPETNLHPGAQKRFRIRLDSLCAKYNKRMMLTTHSTIFVDGWESASVHKVDINKGLTSVSEAIDREQLASVAQLLGVSPGDAFSADGIIWVEGPSDLVVYTAFFKALGTDLNAENISMMWVGGETLRHVHVDELGQLNPNFSILVDSERTSVHSTVPRWKLQLAKECEDHGHAFFMTERRSIENYFTAVVISRYYQSVNVPAFGPYDELAVHIHNNVPGKRYAKMRDAGAIARLMTTTEVENLDDLTAALRRVQSLISDWKHLT